MKSNIIGSMMFLLGFTVEALANDEAVVSGYLRGTYHSHDIKGDDFYEDDAFGGKLHFETASYDGLKLGSSLYATTKVFNDDNNPVVSLRGEQSESYAIVGELYLAGEFDNTLLKIGRQELNTPFADMDDIGMVPNTFEAATLENHDIEALDIYLGHIHKMAGVGAEVTNKFTRLNGSHGMQVLGLTYVGIENVILAAWYNRLKGAEFDGIAYLEATYEKKLSNYEYVLALQYADESYENGEAAKVWGAKVDLGIASTGLVFSGAYNEAKDNVANSGFGGGPFFASSEFLLIDNAGANGNAKTIGVEYNAQNIGMKSLTLGLSKIYIETKTHQKSSEIDMIANYEITEQTDVHVAYVDVKGLNIGEDDAKHFHLYVNYHF